MRKVMKYIVFAALGTILLGCAAASKEIRIKAYSERMDVFREVQDNGVIPKGFADLIIQASIKTHLEGFYLIEWGETFHGKPNYPFLLNIDGQSITWKIDGQKEIAPYYDEKGSRNPERGEGMKYNVKKKIRLAAGSHRLFFALPSENIFKEIGIRLNEGQLHLIEIRPIYRGRSFDQKFLYGIRGLEIYLDGIVVGRRTR